MPGEDKKQPIVVKKVKKGGHGHHGGSWKVAYADFVTAMMAFFLLMWLLGSTTDATREGIADYFNNPAAPEGPGGASNSMIDFGGAMEIPKGEGDPFKNVEVNSAEDIRADLVRLDDLMQRIRRQIESNSSLKEFRDQMLLDVTSQGLRIQIVDRKNRPMFDRGSSRLKWYTREILHELAKTIDLVPNYISLTGHTDATRYSTQRRDYSNWELSADRANAARRALVGGGLNGEKVGRVVGLASSVLFDKTDPYNPINRRISIVVMNRETQAAVGLPPLDEKRLAKGEAEEAPVEVPEIGVESEQIDPAGDLEQALERVLGPPPE